MSNKKTNDEQMQFKNELNELKKAGLYETNECGEIRIYKFNENNEKQYLTEWFTTRGGRREGAGRPTKDGNTGNKRILISARISKNAYDKLMNIKQNDSIGETIDKLIYNYKTQ